MSSGSTGGGLHRDDSVCQRILRSADHYGVIGVPRQADEAAVKSAFRRHAREVHPDKNASPAAAEAFKKLQKAYEVLADPKSRRRYDVYGESEPQPAPGPGYRTYHHHYHHSGPRPEMTPLFTAMLPVFLSMLFMFLMTALLSWKDMQNGGAAPWQQKRSKRSQAAPRELIMKLTRQNADKACGVPSKDICVVLLTDGSQHEREKQLLQRLHNETSMSIRNSRGQSLQLQWAYTTARGRWSSLLPSGATLPWAVVIKPTRNGLRAAVLPVPSGGGKKKRRLSEGVPKLLQDIASGSAKFQQLQGNVSKLFQDLPNRR